MSFTDREITNYPLALKKFFKTLPPPEKTNFLKFHQYLLIKYIATNPKHRGILIMHQTGTGKTLTAVAIAEQYREIEPSRKIIILAAKSLISNFKDSVEKFYKMSGKNTSGALNDYKFVSLNAGNMFSQLQYATLTEEQKQFDDNFGDFVDKTKGLLDDSLLIVDEAHHIFTAITNGSKNGIRFYDAVMSSTNVKLIFLTGTPVINDPFELVPCFNMLAGSVMRGNRRNVLLPELREDFYNYFIDEVNLKIKNKSRFENRVVGLTSYFGEVYVEGQREDFPEEYPIKIIKVHMSNEQYNSYTEAREREIEEKVIGKQKSDRFSAKADASSTYRVKSRQISNFYIPEHARGARRGRKIREKYIGRITNADFKKLHIYSPKMMKILENIERFNGLPGVVYSSFTAGEGLGIFERVLKTIGYKKFGEHNEDDDKIYSAITGEVSVKDRDLIIGTFNDKKNMHGEVIQLLLISGAGSEGLDLKYGRHIHIMEPYWNMARIEQVIARIVRYKSHIDLPAREQNVQPFIYLSDYPKNFEKNKIKEPTTDLFIYEKAMKRKELINDFIYTIIETSIDCHAYYDKLSAKLKKKIHCKICNPNGKRLFHPVIQQDMLLEDPCETFEQEQVVVQEILLEDTSEKFYYTIEKTESKIPKITIFEYNDAIDGFTIMKPNHMFYADLMRKILESINYGET